MKLKEIIVFVLIIASVMVLLITYNKGYSVGDMLFYAGIPALFALVIGLSKNKKSK
jgi:hypothetical protein